MSAYEVPTPILNSAFAEPMEHWYIRPNQEAQRRSGRRPSIVYPPREGKFQWTLGDVLTPSTEYNPGYEMALVNRIRKAVNAWREEVLARKSGVTSVTLELMQYWRREGRRHRLFFAQLEAVETIIFLTEAREDLLQGITVPMDEPSEQQRDEGARAFRRYACKMATGSGKTTVMGMLAAWSILNKRNNSADSRFSDVVLIVCPNVTIRNRLAELDPRNGDASLYRTRDLVPEHLMPRLREGRVLMHNWHVFELQAVQTGGVSARVSKAGVEQRTIETITIGEKSTTARGTRYLTEDDLRRQRDLGLITVVDEISDKEGNPAKVKIESVRYVESDTAWIKRVLGQEIGGKQNLLVFNDEAHHAYRINFEEPRDWEELDEEEREEILFNRTEATVWIDGLDRVSKIRGINACIDLSATPYYLNRVGQEANKPFPWVVSDFSLTDAIESGLVKIPQLAVRDVTGSEIPGYFNIWKWIMEPGRLTTAERGGKKASPKPEAILKWSHTPIAMLGGLWEQELLNWQRDGETRPPVFILVCKNTRIAKVVFDWLAEGRQAAGIAPSKLDDFRNSDGKINTIRVDTKVVHETDTAGAKADEVRWMRATLDTVGKENWPADGQGRPIYPEGFEELAGKLKRPLHPPGRDVRCIVSVGMLTEGWDCNTVTHIIGLRPFMSQLLCEQVVGRGLRRASYQADEDGKFPEEVAKVFGVPFEVIPFKANPQGPDKPLPERRNVHAVPSKATFRITFPRVDGYTQAVRNRVIARWDQVPTLLIDPLKIPPEVQVKGAIHQADGRPSFTGPGKLESVTLNPYRQKRRVQELVFDLASAITRSYAQSGRCGAPAHALFAQIAGIVQTFMDTRVEARAPAEIIDVFCSPYYGWAVETLSEAIRPDESQGEAPEVPRYEQNRKPGSTDDVSFWTSRDVREVVRSHLNYVVADTRQWEQSAAYFIDTHPATAAFVKNSGLGFAIPYLHNGELHDYEPDFIVRLNTDNGQSPRHLILETKGYDPLEQIKTSAARRWVAAVNADGQHGHWEYGVAHKPTEVAAILAQAAARS